MRLKGGNKMKYYEINETAVRQARECWITQNLR